MDKKQKPELSLCVCGLVGDGVDSEHLDTPFSKGHGASINGKCARFTWKRFLTPEEVEAYRQKI